MALSLPRELCIPVSEPQLHGASMKPAQSSIPSIQLKVFLGSPGDVDKERSIAEEVLAEMNRTVALSHNVFFLTRRWELDTTPQLGEDTQRIVNEQIGDMAKIDLFVGIMWNRAGSETPRAQSGTIEEYHAAVASYKRNGHPDVWFYFRNTRIERPSDDQLEQLKKVNAFRALVKRQGNIASYGTEDEFARLFRNHLTNWLSRRSSPKNPPTTKDCTINPYKLYYYRQTRKKSFTQLARETALDRRMLRRLENTHHSRANLDASKFPSIDGDAIQRIERSLECPGRLAGGQRDDFLSQYLLFFETYKNIARRRGGKEPPSLGQSVLRFKTRAVVFDFGGTLTLPRGKYTTWETIWTKLGYEVNRCSELHRHYQTGKLSHQQWCDETCKAFRERGLTSELLEKYTKGKTRAVPGLAETIVDLRKKGIKLYIASGSLKPIIKVTLGTVFGDFEEVRANDVIFDRNGVIERIESTPYDFRGKADFLKRIVRELNVSPLDVLFVGNSCNDVFASESGVRTLCVNPRFTDPDNQEHWTYAIREMSNLQQILGYVYM